MKSGILREDEGYDLLVDGQVVSFDDRKDVAIERAVFGKQGRYKHQLCQVRDRSDGTLITVLADGRTA
jgi:hypothetical protein